jgi:DNA-directed RNA polymerase subunit M/transcription elongation factor TFIIS
MTIVSTIGFVLHDILPPDCPPCFIKEHKDEYLFYSKLSDEYNRDSKTLSKRVAFFKFERGIGFNEALRYRQLDSIVDYLGCPDRVGILDQKAVADSLKVSKWKLFQCNNCHESKMLSIALQGRKGDDSPDLSPREFYMLEKLLKYFPQ